MTFGIFSVTLRGTQCLPGVEGQPPAPCETCGEPMMAPSVGLEVLNVFATYCFAYSTHGNIPVVISEVKNPTRTRCFFIFAAIICYASMIYLIMANMGYL